MQEEDRELTQDVLQIMRRAGVIAGVNPPPAHEDPDQLETSSEVLLVNRPPEELASTKRGRNFSFFTVDLKRFRNVERITGKKIGMGGARFLASSLRSGCCPRLREVNLGWNDMKRVGAESLFAAFRQGSAAKIEKLDLRMNHIDAHAMRAFSEALAHGALPQLTVLDLRQNVIGDRGAQALAHSVLAGHLETLEELYLMQNEVNDIGITAIFKAFTAQAAICPRITCVNVRNNSTTPETRIRMDPCPAFFRY